VAASPARLAHGRLWLLASSGLLAERPVGASIISFVLLAVLVLVVCGGRTFWWAAAFGHVGSTVAVYAAIWMTRLADPRAFANIFTSRDYGVSAISASWLGALATVGWRIRGRNLAGRMAIGLSCVAVGLFAYSARPGLTIIASEHVLAFAFGVAVASRFLDPVRDLARLRALGVKLAHGLTSVLFILPRPIRALDPVVLGTVTVAAIVVGGSALPNAVAALEDTIAPGPFPTPARCISAWNHPSGWRLVEIPNAPVTVASGHARRDFCSYTFTLGDGRRFTLVGRWRQRRIVSWTGTSELGDELPTNAVVSARGDLEFVRRGAPDRI
jgi:hypothetical protein